MKEQMSTDLAKLNETFDTSFTIGQEVIHPRDKGKKPHIGIIVGQVEDTFIRLLLNGDTRAYPALYNPDSLLSEEEYKDYLRAQSDTANRRPHYLSMSEGKGEGEVILSHTLRLIRRRDQSKDVAWYADTIRLAVERVITPKYMGFSPVHLGADQALAVTICVRAEYAEQLEDAYVEIAGRLSNPKLYDHE